MRLAFLLLLFANLGFFAYLNYMRPASHAGVDLQKLQIAPEKIRLLKSAKSASTAPRLAAQACLEWGRFAGPTAAKADAFVAELALPEAQVQRVSADVVGHWVYVPPAKTRAAADTNVRRLKQNGISEYALVLEQTQWRYAI
jgi:hypothetical protein